MRNTPRYQILALLCACLGCANDTKLASAPTDTNQSQLQNPTNALPSNALPSNALPNALPAQAIPANNIGDEATEDSTQGNLQGAGVNDPTADLTAEDGEMPAYADGFSVSYHASGNAGEAYLRETLKGGNYKLEVFNAEGAIISSVIEQSGEKGVVCNYATTPTLCSSNTLLANILGSAFHIFASGATRGFRDDRENNVGVGTFRFAESTTIAGQSVKCYEGTVIIQLPDSLKTDDPITQRTCLNDAGIPFFKGIRLGNAATFLFSSEVQKFSDQVADSEFTPPSTPKPGLPIDLGKLFGGK